MTLDFVMELPTTPSGYDAALVIVDRMTLKPRFCPTPSDVDAPERPMRCSSRSGVVRMESRGKIVSDRDDRDIGNLLGPSSYV